MGTAVVTGPHLHNFSEISRRMDEAGAVSICADAAAVEARVAELLAQPAVRAQMVNAGFELVARGRGALERTLALVEPRLPPAR